MSKTDRSLLDLTYKWKKTDNNNKNPYAHNMKIDRL